MYSENKRYCMVPLWSGSLLRAVSPGSKREYSRVTLLVIQPANEFNCRVKVNGHVTLVTVPVVHAYRTQKPVCYPSYRARLFPYRFPFLSYGDPQANDNETYCPVSAIHTSGIILRHFRARYAPTAFDRADRDNNEHRKIDVDDLFADGTQIFNCFICARVLRLSVGSLFYRARFIGRSLAG